MMKQSGFSPSLAFLVILASGCAIESRVGSVNDDDPHDDPPLDNKAFGNIQPHHVRESQYHEAIQAYGPNALFVCNGDLPGHGVFDDLRVLAGPDVMLLANDNSTFVPLWGQNSEMWNAYRAAMDPATVGLPDTTWYWHDANGERMRAPMPCTGGGWCGGYWPGWALKPDTSAYRAKAEFLATRMSDFDGLFLDEWREGFMAYQLEGLGLPPERQAGLSQQWIVCRRFYVDLLRELAPDGFLLVPNLQPARYTDYPAHEMARFDGHTCEFPDEFDLARFRAHPSPYSIGWIGDLDEAGVVRMGFGLPGNVDP